ncbi:MAG: hypothetical protein RBR74_13525, partial [Ignavibacteriaceae bacterium]|nr:hypothetical protein [Ignavibacteriaceae bacterium]
MFNRNFFFAFALIFASFVFFNSDLYNYTILKKEKPSPVILQKNSSREETQKQEVNTSFKQYSEQKAE